MVELQQQWILVGPWLLASIACVAFGVHGMLRRRGGARLGRAALLVLGAWLSPVVQLPLYQAANHAFFDQAWPFIGRPVSDVVSEFGSPSRSQRTLLAYNKSPWYAPLGFSTVLVVLGGEGTVEHVYYDHD